MGSTGITPVGQWLRSVITYEGDKALSQDLLASELGLLYNHKTPQTFRHSFLNFCLVDPLVDKASYLGHSWTMRLPIQPPKVLDCVTRHQ